MTKSKNILSLGFDIPSKCPSVKVSWDFDNEFISLSDFDYVILGPYSGEDADDYWAYRSYWKSEITSFLSRGGVLFVVLDKFRVHDEYHGATSIPVSNYEILPFSVDYRNSAGSMMTLKSPLMSELFTTFKDRLEYKVYITDKRQRPTFSTRNGDKTLGGIINHNNGYVVFLPYLELICDDSSDFTPKELKLGQQFITCLNNIYNNLHGNPSEAPKWVNEEKYQTRKAIQLQKEASSLKTNIENLKSQLDNLNVSINQERELLALLYETGKPLERAVSKALYILGYTEAENYSDGILELDQVIISPEGDRFIGECEGKDKSDISVDKFRQLHDSIQEDFAREDVDEMAMGLLFGNPHRLTEPDKRSSFFTDKCMNNASRAGIALIKTTDLYEVARYVSDSGDMEFAKKCRQAIKDQLGKVVKFPEGYLEITN